VYENLKDGKIDRSSLSFILRRRFRDGWTMTASYTGSRTEGNCYNTRNSFCALGYGEYRAITNEDGVPLSVVNRDGRVPNDLTHSLKVRGNYLFRLGRGHTINLSGFAWHQSGSTWNLVQNVTVPAPVDPPTDVTITEFLEPFGARRLPSTFQVDLSGSWRFPIAGRFSGTVLIEVINVTDEQELTSVPNAGRISGDPWDSVANYNIQNPREYRAFLTLSF
jgi:outer membrane receptor protein involved in Fe transport